MGATRQPEGDPSFAHIQWADRQGNPRLMSEASAQVAGRATGDSASREWKCFMTTSNPDWIEIILGKADAATKWQRILDALRDATLSSSKPGALDRLTVAPDQLLANSAWNLWEEFLHSAPLAIDELKKYWAAPKASGQAFLTDFPCGNCRSS